MIIETTNAKVHIAAGNYQYVEADVPIQTLDELLELADKLKKRDDELRYRCQHIWAEIQVAKSGKNYRKCPECGAVCFEDTNGSWSQWKMPVKGGE